MQMSRYKYLEKVLYEYANNLERQESMTEELEYLTAHGDLRVQNYHESSMGGDVSDRVLDYVHRKHQLEKRLPRVNMEVWAVSKVLEELDGKDDEKLLKVLNAVYFAGASTIQHIDGIDDREIAHLRWRLVRLAGKYMKEYENNTFHREQC